MRTETFSATELETKLSEGWKLVERNIIAGKVRTVVMEKAGNKFEYIDGETKVKDIYIASLSKAERRRYFENAKLYARGLDK